MFWAEIRKISEFLSENFQFLVVKFSIYLNRRVFVMGLENRARIGRRRIRIKWIGEYHVTCFGVILQRIGTTKEYCAPRTLTWPKASASGVVQGSIWHPWVMAGRTGYPKSFVTTYTCKAENSGSDVIKLVSCSTQLSMKFSLLINMKKANNSWHFHIH